MNRFLSSLPQIYAHLWPKSLASLAPQETLATCGDCLCSKKLDPKLPSYRPDMKCCTFHPFMPNFLIGEILGSPEIKESTKEIFRQKIKLRQYALPLGIFAPVSYQVKFSHREPQDFGNREDLLCPYFDREKNNCQIWAQRGAVCTTYYCTSNQGEGGMLFWEAMGDYLHSLEMTLAQDFIASRGFSPELLEAQLEYLNCSSGSKEELASESLPLAHFQYLWLDYSVAEIEDFYISASRHVRAMDNMGLETILEPEVKNMEEVLTSLYKEAGFQQIGNKCP